MSLPRIAVTLGDPAGIGPEITAKMFAAENLYKHADVFVIGDMFPMMAGARAVDPHLMIRLMKNSTDIKKEKDTINLLDIGNPGMSDIAFGENSAKAGRAAFIALKKAIDLANAKKIDAIVTAPLSKKALHMAGYNYPGHTEILAKFTKTKKFAMMLMSDKLKVILATIHTSIKKVPSLLKTKDILSLIELSHRSLKKDFGIKEPRIAVLGLNPHAGEGGAFGDEEARIIAPAIKKALKKGIKASGPYPADTVFNKAIYEKKFDALICMYHDQGLIPLKLLSFDTGVNVTLGLPIVRTSPDHGTAFDIAGTGKASASSITAAFYTAIEMVKKRKKYL
jgi:4-hydroxythreonine-4-phosphate dehydrogenase